MQANGAIAVDMTLEGAACDNDAALVKRSQAGDTRAAMQLGARYWQLSVQGRAREVVLDVGSATAHVVEGERVVEVIDLMAEYHRLGRVLGPVAAWVLSRLNAA